jgi:type IV pilus assembly protein PilY1
MTTLRTLFVTALLGIAVSFAPAASADDIDIFLGASGGSSDAPNVMFLIDNGPNWSRQAQGWTDPTTGAKITQGVAELNALQQVLTYLANQNQPINVGLAMLTPYNSGNSTGGGYIRFGARDMSVATNRTALQNILANIEPCVGGCGQANESLSGMSHKDETAALYELYKYFSGLAPFTGGPNSINVWDDTAGNLGGGTAGSGGLTAYAQGLSSGWAIANGRYQSPLSSSKPCAASYIIYIANNAQGQLGSTENVYEPSVVPALTALAATSTDTWTDEWTRYLFQSGAVAPQGNSNGSIVTYVLDAYNAQNNAGYSASLQAAARQGGGRYYQVGSEAAVYNALVRILEQIQAVNSTFASASLPVNATNRAQDQNQVYVPMFRPDAGIQPRWFGNLKQYQLINDNGSIELGDAKGQPAINPLTGFPTACAKSLWTTGSADITDYPNGYWDFGQTQDAAGMWNTTMEVTFAKGTCPTTGHGPYDDYPDGPTVEKGGVAEVIRKGNNPSVTNSTPTWRPSLRNVLTINAQSNGWSNTKLVPFTTGNTGLPASLVNWVLGQDVQDENGNAVTAETRPSVHGDEIHSRPLPVDFGSGAVRVFYGSNDGTLRAVDGNTGRELWAFVPPEFYNPIPAVYTPGATPAITPTGLERLMWSGMTDAAGNQISPIIKFWSTPTGVTPAPVAKDYFYDGSIGLYESAVNAQGAPTSVWIYPSMRRGGRMLYAMDVTDIANPAVLWKFGCPDLADDLNCVAANGSNVTSIGQTWSTPAVAASVMGYNTPVVIVGGGYDGCEDANMPNPATTLNPSTGTPYCPTPQKGAGVYVLDAHTGSQLAFFATLRSVAADVALISIAMPGVVDHAYAADTGGNIYRIDFGSDTAHWVMNRVAYTNGSGRKFLFAPALLAAPGNQVYVAIGSGDREHPLQAQYPYAFVLNRFYVFKDNLSSTAALNLDDTMRMQDFTYSSSDPGLNGATNGTACGTPGILPASTGAGWFMNLNQNGQGEQTVTSAIIAAGMAAFSTNRPIPQAQGTCATTLGAAYGYWVNLFNASGGIGPTAGPACGGTRDTQFVGGGLPPSPVIATVPVAGQTIQAVIGAGQLSGGTSCGICPQQVKPAIIPTRKTIFWKSSGDN